MSVSVSTTAGTQVTVTVDGSTRLSFTTEESSISVVNGDTSSISVTNQGPKGDTGATGATGATGPGVIAGGTANEFLQKNSATDYDTKWSAYTLPAADGADGQVLTTDGGGRVSFAFPKTIAEDVKNVSGGPLSKGTPVHVTGSVGNLAEVTAADASTNYPAHFVLDEDLADGGEGKGIALGFINNVDVPDASIYTEGQTVYLGASGGWTTTKPTGANAIQNLGILIKVNTSGNKVSGIIMGAGRANDVPNIPNGQAWIGNASGVATPTTLATVATSGSYNDLSDQPTIPTDTNLGNSDQTLSAERTVEMSANAIVFDNSSSEVARIFPQGYIRATGRSIINGNGSIGGQVILKDADSSNGVTLQCPLTVGSDLTLILPDSDGSSGQVLKTDGSGVLSFGDSVTEVSGDTTPQLGGDLDVNGNKITSASNGDITIDPNGTGAIIFKSDDIQFDGDGGLGTGKIRLYESDIVGSNFIALSAPLSVTSDTTLTLPDGAGSSGQVLSTNGLGTLSWITVVSTVNPDFTGFLDIRSAGASQGTLFLYDSDDSNYISFKVPSTVASNVNFILPGADGSANQVLKTDGSGNLSFDEVGDVIGNRKFTKTSNTDADSNGDVVYFGGTTSMTAGALYMYTSFGTWALANANAASTCDGLLGIALGAASDTDGVLLRGMVTIDHDPGAVGDVLFASTTAGDITATSPSGTGDIVRIVGYCLDASNGQIWFNPDGTFVEVA